MREINVNVIEKNIEEMCIQAAHTLSNDMVEAIKNAKQKETSIVGQMIFDQLEENLKIAKEEMIPICQDTGMVVVFLTIGQDVHFVGGSLTNAINNGVHNGYVNGYLRKSVVADPIKRVNTKDNTPAIIYTDIVEGQNIDITVELKGFGSENKSKIYMLEPADGIEGVKKVVINTVKEAGPNACPPMVIGVGIGGTFDKCAQLSKHALTRDVNIHSNIPYVKELEEELYQKLNELDIGPAGLGGSQTVLAVNIETYPTHIASLPVAVNICCHANRHVTRSI